MGSVVPAEHLSVYAVMSEEKNQEWTLSLRMEIHSSAL